MLESLRTTRAGLPRPEAAPPAGDGPTFWGRWASSLLLPHRPASPGGRWGSWRTGLGMGLQVGVAQVGLDHSPVGSDLLRSADRNRFAVVENRDLLANSH